MSPLMPARCQDCGHAFSPPLIHIEDSVRITLSDVGTVCPRCGGPANVIEGTVTVANGGIELLQGPQWSQDLIDELRLTLVRIVTDRPVDPIAVLRETAPSLASEVEAATEGWTRDQKIDLLFKVLMAILAAVTAGAAVTTAVRAGQGSTDTPDLRQQVVDILRSAQLHGSPPTAAPLPGRNEQCWCGSQRKYKKCHGAWQPPDSGETAE
ncbi:SEC-C metal-binding domain-containing protein [Nocardioides sp. CPCC 205120]|uniref:SEC-C metal-binding domain-containing protein n=1 Tax=Nocardioides sp. CPCC 205120 TaxID=3406462 RepID=UPI003B50010D